MAPEDRIVTWKGGTLDDLVGMLSGAALAARVHVMAPGEREWPAGEVQMLAGGVAESIAGDLRGDDAMAALRSIGATTFRVEPALPEPGTGALVPGGPEEGNLSERPLASLMRYCENYVMTCLLEVWRGNDRATISYRRGEIASTAVGGSDAPERLTEVMTWNRGGYRIVVPPMVLPNVRPPPSVAAPPKPAAKPAAAKPAPTPPPIPMPPPVAAPAESRDTLTRVPPAGPPRGRRETVPGMPVAVFDPFAPERTTDVGVPAVGPVPTPRPSTAAAPRTVMEPEVIAPVPLHLLRNAARPAPPAPKSNPAVPALGPMTAPRGGKASASAEKQGEPTPNKKKTKPRRKTLVDPPVLVLIFLGLALGLAIVGAYSVMQTVLAL